MKETRIELEAKYDYPYTGRMAHITFLKEYVCRWGWVTKRSFFQRKRAEYKKMLDEKKQKLKCYTCKHAEDDGDHYHCRAQDFWVINIGDRVYFCERYEGKE